MTAAQRRAGARAATRDRILAAARTLYLAGGEDAVTMRRIAEAIDYSVPVIYAHFADKHALMRAISEIEWRALADVITRATARRRDPVARLRAGARAYVDFALAHADAYRLLFMVPVPPEQRRDTAARGDQAIDPYALLRVWVAAVFATGRVRASRLLAPDAEATFAHALWQGVHGVVAMHLARDDGWTEPVDPRDTAALLVDLLLDGLLEPTAAA